MSEHQAYEIIGCLYVLIGIQAHRAGLTWLVGFAWFCFVLTLAQQVLTRFLP